MKSVRGLGYTGIPIRSIHYRAHDLNPHGPMRIWLDTDDSDRFEIVDRGEFNTFLDVASRLGFKIIDQDEVDAEEGQ